MFLQFVSYKLVTGDQYFFVVYESKLVYVDTFVTLCRQWFHGYLLTIFPFSVSLESTHRCMFYTSYLLILVLRSLLVRTRHNVVLTSIQRPRR